MIEMSTVARDVVSAQPDPPRRVGLRHLLRTAYGTSAARWVVGVGGVLGGFVVVVGIIATGELIWRVVLILISGTLLLASVGAPAMLALRARRALSRGVRTSATVTEVSWSAPGDRSTIDSLTHGMARGRRRVEHPSGPFTNAFETDASWARDLRPGSVMLLLVDPAEPRVLFDLGRGTASTDVETPQ